MVQTTNKTAPHYHSKFGEISLILFIYNTEALIGCVLDQKVYWWEAILLIVCYFGYVYIMYRNKSLKLYVTNRVNSPYPTTYFREYIRDLVDNYEFDIIITIIVLVNLPMIYLEYTNPDNSLYSSINHGFTIFYFFECIIKLYSFGPIKFWQSEWNLIDGFLCILMVITFCS